MTLVVRRAVAEDARQMARVHVDGVIVGIALAGLVQETAWSHHLHLIYVDRDHHGSGAAVVLLHAVLDPRVAAALWVADPNPRAQAFYAKRGFAPDGTVQYEEGVRELRWVRLAEHQDAGDRAFPPGLSAPPWQVEP